MNSKFNKLFKTICEEFDINNSNINKIDSDGQEQIQQNDTHCMSCNEVFCLDSAIQDKENNCYRCPYCGSDKLEDNVQ